MNLAQMPVPEFTHHLRRLEVLDRVTHICLSSKSMEVSMQGVLYLVLEVFGADRAWFLYPCDPEEPYWRVPMECTRPEWPGLLKQGVDMPMDASIAALFKELLEINRVIQYGPDIDNPVPVIIAEEFSVQSQVMIVLRPKLGNAWVFGLHHCSDAVIHHDEDLKLFTAVAHRISDNLSLLISINRMRSSERHSKVMADAVIDNAGVLVLVQDKEGRIVRFNRACEKLTGYSFAEVEGKHARDMLLSQAKSDTSYQSGLANMAQSHRSLADHYTNHWLDRDDKRHLIEWTSNQLLDDSGNIEFIVSLGTDITERKRDQQLLDMMKFSMNHMSDKVIWVTADARVVYANIAACKSLGYTHEEMLTLSVPDFDPDFSAEDWPVHWEVLKNYGSLTFETRHLAKNGGIHPVEVTANYMRIGDEEYNCAYARDITQRKQIEADLRISAAAFDTYESMLITDADSVILRVNRAFTESTGYTAAEVVGRTPRMLKSDFHNAEFYRTMWEAIRQTGTWQGEIWDKRKNGEIYPKWLTISAVKSIDGVVTHYVGSHIDITKRKAAEEKI